ncbi:protein senC [Amylibacter kogurei]|uniref:Protein senC n=1 Tax=Paramylibacter kogurei TaxID=1889778 RepID=A0A2G5KAQ0_9RHOB|nr:SCO family protein [Amylibacter kogurei]PIB26515.1 protein senC [Amylibacter kogurei]
MSKNYAILAASVVTIGLAAGAGFVLLGKSGDQCSDSAIAGGAAAIGGPFTLVNQAGEQVTEKDVIKDYSLIYFGYTYCPDICPLDTARNLEAVDILDARGIKIDPVFITIDPARDTPQVLADYAEIMHPRLIALTGSEEQISAASKTYKTYRAKNGEGDADYLMDHSTFTYLMSPSGFVDFFRREATPEDMADKIACYTKG